jgi:hypothetical protein
VGDQQWNIRADFSEFVAPGEAIRLVEKLHGGHTIRFRGSTGSIKLKASLAFPAPALNLSKLPLLHFNMDTVLFVCPGCKHVLPVPDVLANYPGTCPKCGEASGDRRIPVMLRSDPSESQPQQVGYSSASAHPRNHSGFVSVHGSPAEPARKPALYWGDSSSTGGIGSGSGSSSTSSIFANIPLAFITRTGYLTRAYFHGGRSPRIPSWLVVRSAASQQTSSAGLSQA